MSLASAALGGAPLDPDDLHLSARSPVDGRAIRYHADEFAASWMAVLAEELGRSAHFAAAAGVFDREMLLMHLENALHYELMGVCRAYTRRKHLKSQGYVSAKAVECPVELISLVRSRWPDASIALTPRAHPMAYVRRLARARHRVVEFIARTTGRANAAAGSRPVIAVEIVEGADPHQKSEAFWLADPAVDPGEVLFVFDRNNRTLLKVEAEHAAITALGAKAVALHPSVSADGKIPLWVPPRAPKWLRNFRAAFARPRSSTERWLVRTLRDFAETVWRWESFFRHFNVCIYQQFTEFAPDIAAKRVAIDRVGGIELGKMRSQFFNRSCASFYFQHEIALVWHENVQDVLGLARTRTREVVAVGYVWSHLFKSLAPEARALRAKLTASGVKRVLVIFDNAIHPNGRFSMPDLEAFYARVVDVALHCEDIGLIVKSKKRELLGRMPAIDASLRRLEGEGRCLILDKHGESIVPAALAADLVLAIPASTAACEAALGGRNVLMYDPSGSLHHPLCGNEKGVIHND
ncbi:MAG TPA: hypothetical protein VD867_17395, partial [Burkholderiales bacterium]|nr:hypothetical protein [Burkholderiales bacterium]